MARVNYPWDGTLNNSEVLEFLYNLIISETVYTDSIKGTFGGLVNKFRREGGQYGDTKLFVGTNLPEVYPWRGDAEANNLLALKRVPPTKPQAVTIDQFAMVWLTTDSYLSKRAWGSEALFTQFQSTVLSNIRTAKEVFEAGMLNVTVGTHVGNTTAQNVEVAIPLTTGSMESDDSQYDVTDVESHNRLEANYIAEAIANLMVDIEDISTAFNDAGAERSYSMNDLVFVFNSKYVNKLRKVSLPTIFHNDGLIAKLGENIVPARFFGTLSEATTTDGTTRAAKCLRVANNAVVPEDADLVNDVRTYTYYKAGQLLPAGITIEAGDHYTEDDSIVCKILHKDSIQYMSGFEAATEFVNSRSLTRNSYLIWAFSDPKNSILKELPFITVKVVDA